MTRYFALALAAANPAPKTKSQAVYKPKDRVRIENWGVFIAAAICVAAVAYLFQVNSLSAKGMEIQKLQSRLTDLKETSERLELEARSLKSIETIQGEATILNFVPTGKMGHIDESTNVSYR